MGVKSKRLKVAASRKKSEIWTNKIFVLREQRPKQKQKSFSVSFHNTRIAFKDIFFLLKYSFFHISLKISLRFRLFKKM